MKPQDLEDRSRRDNLRFDGITEYKNKSWKLPWWPVEYTRNKNCKAHGTSERNSSSPRTIVAKFSSYNAKEHILRKASSLKGTGYSTKIFKRDTSHKEKSLEKS